MPTKGYISFDDFKALHPSKSRVPRCPRCKKPMTSIVTNIFGKRMCGECFAEEEQKRETAIKKRQEIQDKKIIEQLQAEEDIIEANKNK